MYGPLLARRSIGPSGRLCIGTLNPPITIELAVPPGIPEGSHGLRGNMEPEMFGDLISRLSPM